MKDRRALLTYKVLCGIAPRYLEPLNRIADVSGRRSLSSSGTVSSYHVSDYLQLAVELFRLCSVIFFNKACMYVCRR